MLKGVKKPGLYIGDLDFRTEKQFICDVTQRLHIVVL